MKTSLKIIDQTLKATWFIYLLAIILIHLSGCSFQIKSEYFGKTGIDDRSVSPELRLGQQVAAAGRY